MKSNMAKVLHPVGGRSMIDRAVDHAWELDANPPVVVVGYDAEAVRAQVGERARYVIQAEQLGTGHAALQAADLLRGQSDQVLMFLADMPLLTGATLHKLRDAHQKAGVGLTMLTLIASDPRGFGRVIRDTAGVTAIVEEHECTPEQLAIHELNSSVYIFEASWLWDHLPRIKPKSKGEFYLTDLVEMAAVEQMGVQGIIIDDPNELIGVNTRVHLSEAEAILRRRVAERWMLAGVTIRDPAATYIDERATIGLDTLILPNTHIVGATVIGAGCTIGPNTVIENSKIGAGCRVTSSFVEGATLEDQVEIGPLAHLRMGAYLAAGVHMGNFGEVKNARLGAGTRMGHFSYIGDAEIGADVNIGAGVVTVNYDGKNKHKTVVGDRAFLGSDSMLVAPLTISAESRTAAGSVVTRDVPPGSIAVGVPARMRPLEVPSVPTTQPSPPAPFPQVEGSDSGGDQH